MIRRICFHLWLEPLWLKFHPDVKAREDEEDRRHEELWNKHCAYKEFSRAWARGEIHQDITTIEVIQAQFELEYTMGLL